MNFGTNAIICSSDKILTFWVEHQLVLLSVRKLHTINCDSWHRQNNSIDKQIKGKTDRRRVRRIDGQTNSNMIII